MSRNAVPVDAVRSSAPTASNVPSNRVGMVIRRAFIVGAIAFTAGDPARLWRRGRRTRQVSNLSARSRRWAARAGSFEGTALGIGVRVIAATSTTSRTPLVNELA
ncbi:hypothetical protein [Nocardia sp. MDA0666]|uniref:hypothetical protein n=1 Tax=Nocardia sp. MDA0666 TaxID=2135448 RepID=UPI0011B2997B|nr:hypothetical protein [Nocardia sp. MDA0666]